MNQPNFLFCFRNVFAFLFILTFFGYQPAALAQKKADLKQLDQYIAKAVKDYDLPGLSVGVIKDGKVVFSKGYGVRDVRTKEKVNTETVFGIASLSKAFTAATLGILVDEGKIKWDDKVSKYLPDFKLYDPFITQELTIRDLISHRSGYNTFDGDLLWYGTSYSRKEIMDRFKHMKNKSGFRSQYGYQNIMFIAAGEIVPVVTGKSWDEFLEERILKPLDMKTANTTTAAYKKGQNWAIPHVHGKAENFLRYDNSGGAAAMNASTDDLLKWAEMLLNNGTYKGKQILKPQTVEQLFSPVTLIPVTGLNKQRNVHFNSYGLGWFLFDYHGKMVAHHGGGLPGFISKLALVPEEKLGIVVLTNGETSLPEALMYQIIDVMLGKENKDWANVYLDYSKRYEEFLAKQKADRHSKRNTNSVLSLPLSGYAGTFEDKMYGKAEIKEENGKLKITMLPTAEIFVSDMEHWHYNTFRIKFKDEFLPEGFVNFKLDTDGKATGFTIDLPNPDFHFYNLNFEKVK